jgi:acetyl esterase/lipase
MKHFTFFIFLLAYINCYSQQYSKSWKNLNYAGDSMVYHMLDVYLPEAEKPTYPVVVLIYGSAWIGNNLKGTDLATLGKELLDAGFAVVTPNHRSSTDAKFPAQINDIKAVIRFIRANAAKYQIDTSFIGITGSSSGGHLAALTGTSGFVKQYTVGSATADIEGNVGEYLTYSSSVDAVVDWFGPTDFLLMDSCGSTLVHNAANSPESSLIGGPIQDNPEKCSLANPITYIDSNDPPFLILHGDADPLVPHCESELLFNALQKANVSSQFILVPGAQHGPGLFIDKYFSIMTDFFTVQFGVMRVNTGERDVPTNFSVSQNYPNPFNLATHIQYSVPAKGFISLKVYDLIGQKVMTLFEGVRQPGYYPTTFDAKGLSSGLYLYQLTADHYVEGKKLIVLK